MIGFNSLLNNVDKVQLFFYTGTWAPWQKPKDAKLVYMLCVGGGGGGGGGGSPIGGTNGTGGGGGGAAGFGFSIFPANMLPDILYINIGAGGTAGAPAAASSGSGTGNAGGDGGISYISIFPNTTVQNIVLASGSTRGGGKGGTGSSIGGAGPVWATGTSGANIFPSFSIIDRSSGVSGATGGAGATGDSVTISNVFSGGAGGGGYAGTGAVARPGGNITGADFIPTIPGGGTGVKGSDGFSPTLISHRFLNSTNPAIFTGGAGGGAGISGTTGGAGGNGALGCGGGGGGSSVSVSPGGTGGRGGDGFVIIATW